MKLIIAGSRTITDKSYLQLALSRFQKYLNYGTIAEVVSGGAKGIDTAGEEWAHSEGIPVKRFDPDWDKYGKSAGMIRNADMAYYADALLAIWDGESKGTAQMIRTAKQQGIDVFVMTIKFEQNVREFS